MKRIITLILVLMTVFPLVACNLKLVGVQGEENEVQSDEVVQSVELKKEDIVRIIGDAWNENNSEDMPNYLKELEKRASFEVVNHSITEGYYTVEVEVASLDLKAVLSKLSPGELPTTKDKQELDRFMCTLIDKAQSKKTSCFVYIQGDGEVTFSEEFFDAMCGGIYSYAKEELSDALMNS